MLISILYYFLLPAFSHLRLPASVRMSTIATRLSLHMQSTITKSKGLGILGILPREIRDIIYRYLVKGFYLAACPSSWTRPDNLPIVKLQEERQFVIIIFQLSKAINKEASAIHYNEGNFRCYPDTSEAMLYPPQAQIDRMMKIEVIATLSMDAIFEVIHVAGADEHHHQPCSATVRKLKGVVRKSIHLSFQIICTPILRAISKKTISDLKTLVRYGTVTVEFTPPNNLGDTMSKGRTQGNKSRFEELNTLTTNVMGELESALGCAKLSLANVSTVSGRTKVSSSLVFHPQEHVGKKLEG